MTSPPPTRTPSPSPAVVPPTTWTRTVPGEDWSVGVVLHHIAEGAREQPGAGFWPWPAGRAWATGGRGSTRPNAAHTRPGRGPRPRARRSRSSKRTGPGWSPSSAACSDDDLDRTAPFGPAGGRPFTTGDLAAVAARHTREHLAHAAAGRRRRTEGRTLGLSRRAGRRGPRRPGRAAARPACPPGRGARCPSKRGRRRVARRDGEPAVAPEAQARPAVLHGQRQGALDRRLVHLRAVDGRSISGPAAPPAPRA